MESAGALGLFHGKEFLSQAGVLLAGLTNNVRYFLMCTGHIILQYVNYLYTSIFFIKLLISANIQVLITDMTN